MTRNFVVRNSITQRRTGRVVAALVGSAILVIIIEAIGKSNRRELMTGILFRSNENTIEGKVIINRPVGKVFEFYRNFRNLPSFLGDVMAIEETGATTYRWTIQGPLGIQAHWTIRVTEERINEVIRYETVTSPALRTYWELYFAPGPTADETEVHEVMKAPLGRLGRGALALIGKFPAQEVHANLHRLKQVMETGRVSDTSYAVKGKFDERISN